MQFKVEFAYTAFEVPPRCRNPRRVTKVSSMVVEIREVSGDQAPVAIVAHAKERDASCLAPSKVEYRFTDDRLWTKVNTDHGCARSQSRGGNDWEYVLPESEACAGDALPVIVVYRRDNSTPTQLYNANTLHGVYFQRNESEQEVREALTAWANDGLIIDGVYYRTAPEPRYVVMTFGLACNHGGTSVMVDDHHNTNISAERYFPATWLASAQATAQQIAADRGDTTSLHVDPNPYLEVLIEPAITPHRLTLMADYANTAYNLVWDDVANNTAHREAKLLALRAKMHPDDVKTAEEDLGRRIAGMRSYASGAPVGAAPRSSDGEDQHIRTMHYLSCTTAHLTPTEAEAFNAGEFPQEIHTPWVREYGWLIDVRVAPAARPGLLQKVGDGLAAVLEHAWSLGLGWVELDRDALALANVPVYDW